ncbi:hypothetical protein Mapa_018331 [Marchantia paleacea]|nr:hypothetical protein Mapa_018331 [Marchantia paleacea]
MILGNLVAITQTSMKRMLAYSSISQIGYILIGLITGDLKGYASMTIYVFFYIFMNLGTFACIILYSLRTGTDNIRDYAGLYIKDPLLSFSLTLCLLSLGGLPPLTGFFGKLYLFWCGWQSGFYLLVFIGLITSVISLYYYLKIIKLILTKKNNEMNPYIQGYITYIIASPTFFSKNPVEFIIIFFCVLGSTFLGIMINPIFSFFENSLSLSVFFY